MLAKNLVQQKAETQIAETQMAGVKDDDWNESLSLKHDETLHEGKYEAQQAETTYLGMRMMKTVLQDPANRICATNEW